MGVKERILEFCEYSKITVKKFETECGMSNGYVAAIRKGIGVDKLNNVLTTYPQLSREWLLFGEGSMLSVAAAPAASTDSATIPLIPYLAKGGALSGVGEEGVRRSDCEQIISPLRGADAAITVSGDSMAPKYPSGSRLFIQRVDGSAYIDWGAIYVLDTCNGIIVKKVTASKDTDCVTCVSLNPDPSYAPFDVKKEDVYGMFRVLGCLIFE